MTSHQLLLLVVIAYSCIVLFVVPQVLSFGEHPLFIAVALAVVGLVRHQIVPAAPLPPSPLEILQRSRLWRSVAAIYASLVVATMVWHLFVSRLGALEDVSLSLLFLLMLGPVIGPVIVHLRMIYRLLGDRGAEEQ